MLGKVIPILAAAEKNQALNGCSASSMSGPVVHTV